MSEVRRRRGRPRLTEYRVDEIATAEAIVTFYEHKLDEATEKLGQIIEDREAKLSRTRYAR